MKIWHVGMMVLTVLMSSCLGDNENYQAGFVIERPTTKLPAYYANNISDSLVFYSYGNWTMEPLTGYDNTWVSIPTQSGKGYTIYSQLVRFQENTTGMSRLSCYQLNDVSHPGDAKATLAFWQYATRGDGSLGCAADVKRITGTDGSLISLEYDQLHRPTLVKLQNAEQILDQLRISYDDVDGKMTVTDRYTTYTVDMANDYQPWRLQNASDTIGYYLHYYNQSVAISANYLFNIEHHSSTGASSGVTYLFPSKGVSLDPDSIHNADTLYCYKNSVKTCQLGLTYSQHDNRHQTVDVNQLLLGIDECNPYLLASLFRYARNSSIISEAQLKDSKETISVVIQLNADKSVSKMTVTRGDKSVIYSFEY